MDEYQRRLSTITLRPTGDGAFSNDEAVLARAAQIQCERLGHGWDVIEADGEPVLISCARCGASRGVKAEP